MRTLQSLEVDSLLAVTSNNEKNTPLEHCVCISQVTCSNLFVFECKERKKNYQIKCNYHLKIEIFKKNKQSFCIIKLLLKVTSFFIQPNLLTFPFISISFL